LAQSLARAILNAIAERAQVALGHQQQERSVRIIAELDPLDTGPALIALLRRH
jgi:hypothetical protein